MKKTIIAITAAASIFALSACNNGNDSEVIVQTKAGEITKDELYNTLKERYGEQILQELVYNKVLSEEYKVSEKEINAKVQEIKDQLGPNFEMAMQQAGYKNEDQFKETLKVALLQEKAGLENVKATDKELKEYYDNLKPDIKASHILVEDEKQAKEIAAQANKDNFAELAKKHSKDTVSAEQGGDLDWFGAGKMVPEFEEAAYKLKVGEISEPVKSQFGYHIIMLTDKKELKSFEDMKTELVDEVKRSKLDQSVIDNAIQKVVDKSDVEVKDEDFKDLFKKSESKE